MLSLLADHNFNEDIEAGLRRRGVQFSIVHLREVGLDRATDEEVLEFAADRGMIVITHDLQTRVPAAYRRVASGLAMPGVIFCRVLAALAVLIDGRGSPRLRSSRPLRGPR